MNARIKSSLQEPPLPKKVWKVFSTTSFGGKESFYFEEKRSSLKVAVGLLGGLLTVVVAADAVINRVIDPPFGRKDVPSEFQPE